MTFYDKNGNHYVTNADYGSYICGLKYEELISEYAAGNLDDKLTFHTSCDVNVLFENYQKLCELSQNKDYEIVYPEMIPAVEANEEFWYGFYYDGAGELCALKIHERGAGGDYQANDERANEIYDWYIGTFRAPSEIIAYITNFDSDMIIPYTLKTANGEIIEISEHYVP